MNEGQCEENAPGPPFATVKAVQTTVRWDRVSDASACASAGFDDAALLRRVAGRDRAAFGELMVRHGRRIETICRRFVPPEVVPDACQEVALQLWMAATTYRGDGSVAGWIAAVAHNKAIEVAMKEASRCRRIVATADDHEQAFPVEEPGAYELVADRDLLARVMASVEKPEDRHVFWLVYVEGRDIAEVARQLYLSTETVKSRLKRAKRKLRWLYGSAAMA